MTAAAFDNAGLLRRLARQDDAPIASQAALAAELKRDPANLRKTFKILEGDGIVSPIPGGVPTLTDLGRQTLHGIDVAQGVAMAEETAPGRWPLNRIKPNPANRPIDPEGIEDMALSIAAIVPPDVYTPVTLTPVDAEGFRMLLAGERRWRGAVRALSMDGVAAGPLTEGLLFIEREATEVEALQLMIIENTQREGLSPLEDARQLSRLQQLTGLNGVDLAIHVGRCDRQNKNGAKDVQEKLKIIREATPDAIADYEARGSWDDLRNSVRTKRETGEDGPEIREPWMENYVGNVRTAFMEIYGAALPESYDQQVRQGALALKGVGEIVLEIAQSKGLRPLPPVVPTGPHVVNGVDYYNASRAHQARVAAGLEPRPTANYGGGASAPAAPAELSPRTRLALIELAHKVHAQRQPLDPAADAAWTGDVDQDYAAFGAFVGTYWLETSFSDLQSERLVRAVHLTGGVPPMAALTPKGMKRLIEDGHMLPPSMTTLRNAQGAVGAALPEGEYVTGWIANEAKPAAHAEQPDLIEPTADEIEARRRSAEESEQANLAERSVLHFGGVILGWAKDRRDQGAADHVSLPSRSPRAGNYDDMAQQAFGALADGRFAEAGALLSALQTHVGEDGAGRLLRQMPLPVIQRALMEGRTATHVTTDDDGEEPWQTDPDPSDDPMVTDAELEHMASEISDAPLGDMETRTPAVPIRKSIHPDYIVCLEDGRKFKSLKRHLRTKYDLSPEEYIARWGLPRDYPMMAPNYAKARADLAARMGFGLGERA